jgi:DmpG-like communication domain
VKGADVLMECGRHELVGGQEDQIIFIAAELAAAQEALAAERSVLLICVLSE